MSFGATGRARMLNDMPLRFRLNADAGDFYMGTHTDYDRDEWLQRRVERFGKQTANPPPGWDADGRPVEP